MSVRWRGASWLAVAFLLLLGVSQAGAQGSVLFVAPNGSDTTGDGGPFNPLATITAALDAAAAGGLDGSTILVRPGDYVGRVRLRGVFPVDVTVRSEVPYQARLRHTDTVVTCFEGQGITLEGFDIAHSGPGAGGLVIQIQDLIDDPGGADFVSRITLRNNVIHDSFNNDLLKIKRPGREQPDARQLAERDAGGVRGQGGEERHVPAQHRGGGPAVARVRDAAQHRGGQSAQREHPLLRQRLVGSHGDDGLGERRHHPERLLGHAAGRDHVLRARPQPLLERGPNRQFSNPNGTATDPVNGSGGAGGELLVAAMGFQTVLDPAFPPGSYQVRVIGRSATGQIVGTFSDALTLILGQAPPPPVPPDARVTIIAPPGGTHVAPGGPVTFTWTALAGVTQYGFEFSGANRVFANPNGTGADSVNGFGGAGGGLLVTGTTLMGVAPPTLDPGSYQVRVIGFSAGQPVGQFSDALTVVVP